jgi:LysR family transcriptional regulator, low CO2-responsive transcriptional regulator
MSRLDLNLTHLGYFYDACTAGSIVASAEKNFVTHSAISQGIKRLEQSLGLELMIHKKRQFIITNEGRHLLKACERIFESLDHLQDQVKISNTEPSGELIFAGSHSVISSFLLRHFQPLRKKYPLMDLKFKLGKTPYVRSWVLNRQVEIGVTIDDGQLDDLGVIPLKIGEFVLISKAEHLNLSAVENILLTETRPETTALLKSYRQKYKKDLSVSNEVDSWELISQMSEAGHYTGFIPDFVAQSKKSKIYILKPPIAIRYQLVVVHRKNERLSRNAVAFIDQLKEGLN